MKTITEESNVLKYKNKRGTNPKGLKANGYCILQEAAEILEVSSACLSFWRKWDATHGLPPRLPYRKENGRYYYLKSDVLKYKNREIRK